MARTTGAANNSRSKELSVDAGLSGEENDVSMEVEFHASNKTRTPSSDRPNNSTRARSKQPTPTIVIDDDDDAPRNGAGAAKATKKPPSVNGKSKAAPKPRPKAREQSQDVEVIEEDEEAARKPSMSHTRGTTPAEEPTERPQRTILRLQRQAEKMQRDHEREMARLQQENDRLKEEAEVYRKSHDKLRDLYSELQRQRLTEPEEKLERFIRDSDARAATQDALIRHLTDEIRGLDDLSKDGHTHGLKLLTREATDARMREMQADVVRKDEEIKDLKEELSRTSKEAETAKYDLQQEQAHFQQEIQRLNARQKALPLAGVSSPRTLNSVSMEQQRLDKQSIKVLEDLSGLVILNVQPVQSEFRDGIGMKFRLMLTVDEVDSLTFELTLSSSPTNPSGQEVLYAPLLDIDPKPRDEFREILNFLENPFTFDRGQMAVLGDTLMKLRAREDEQDEDEEMEA